MNSIDAYIKYTIEADTFDIILGKYGNDTIGIVDINNHVGEEDIFIETPRFVIGMKPEIRRQYEN
jgi:hypothetical protein